MSPTRNRSRVTRSSNTRSIIQNDRVLRSHKVPEAVIPTLLNPTSQDQAPKRRRRRAGADPWTPYRKQVKKVTPRLKVPPPTHFTCRICAEEQPTTSFLKWVPLSRHRRRLDQEIPHPCRAHLCRNPRKKTVDPVCKTCIGRAMAAKMEMTGARTVSAGCLEPGCSTPWDNSFIMKFLPLDSLEAYNMGMLPVFTETVNLFRCVSESCSGIGMLDPSSPGFPQIQCADCALRQCSTCKVPWHTDISCADQAAKPINDQMTDSEIETLKLMQSKDGKRCPNCYIVIEKDGGCHNMQCMSCKTYFNWYSAASAVPGTKPADMPQWLYGAPAVCEVDALADGGAAGVSIVVGGRR